MNIKHTHKKSIPLTTENKIIERSLRKVLIIGVAISIMLMVTGLTLYLYNLHINSIKENINNPYFISIFDLVKSALKFNPSSMMLLGVFCLILTPGLKILISLYYFCMYQDYKYVIITLIILLILGLSFYIGITLHK